MNCKETEELLLPFIQSELDVEQVQDFLEHIKTCSFCREELEIYYIVYAEIDGLDNNAFPSYDPIGELEKKIDAAHALVQRNHRYMVCKYALTTLAVIGMIVSFFVQMRLWI